MCGLKMPVPNIIIYCSEWCGMAHVLQNLPPKKSVLSFEQKPGERRDQKKKSGRGAAVNCILGRKYKPFRKKLGA